MKFLLCSTNQVSRQLPKYHGKIKQPQKYFSTTIPYDIAIQQNKVNEEDSLKFISKVASPYIKDNFIFFDIGSNVGYFTYLFFKLFGNKGTSYLFEPIQNLVNISKKLLEPYNNIQIMNFGLSDKNEETYIFIANNGNMGWNTLIKENASHDMLKEKITLKRFDNCEINVTPTFIKIDTEGSEYKVLNGMIESFKLWNPLPVILCEIGWGSSHYYWKEELKAFNNLEKLGYKCFNIDGKPLQINKINQTIDVLFIPQK